MFDDLQKNTNVFKSVSSTLGPLSRKWQRIVDRFFVVTYGLGIYLLNCFILFITPMTDPKLDKEKDQDKSTEKGFDFLPTKKSEDFKPFMRKLGEFQFCYKMIKATFFSIIATLFPFLNLPVLWQLLLLYFIVLFVFMMRKQISHMVKYGYIPINFGKKKYTKRRPSKEKRYNLRGFGDDKHETAMNNDNNYTHSSGSIYSPSLDFNKIPKSNYQMIHRNVMNREREREQMHEQPRFDESENTDEDTLFAIQRRIHEKEEMDRRENLIHHQQQQQQEQEQEQNQNQNHETQNNENDQEDSEINTKVKKKSFQPVLKGKKLD
ncbi:protein rer1 [Anaeramoeba flamelloides]|uniref:Protein rer1 n=1 Tax=Anaeramoeba flamelloides TaxID=1746091 RepID=A0AAV7ZSK3_9EUKA|nr:protein rer1 [Anaeramoeba flamelloides]KAJ6238940.1 protein rer1 [Anaeramoeba flamelloides]